MENERQPGEPIPDIAVDGSNWEALRDEFEWYCNAEADFSYIVMRHPADDADVVAMNGRPKENALKSIFCQIRDGRAIYGAGYDWDKERPDLSTGMIGFYTRRRSDTLE